MTISHILILFVFIALGSAGIASAQDGLLTIWRYVTNKLVKAEPKTAHSPSNMRIV